MKENEFEKMAEKQRDTLRHGEAAITLHTLESEGYYLTIVDEFSEQLIAITETELKQLYKLLKKKYNG